MIRKDGKTLYWVHLQQVVENLKTIGIKDKEILCAGWLHDTIEDTDTDYDDLKKEFGDRVARIVAQVTKDKSLPEKEREQKFCDRLTTASWEAQAIKLCDLWANLADLESAYKIKIVNYAMKMGNLTIVKRLGFLLDALGIKTEKVYPRMRNMISSGMSILDPTVRHGGNYNTKWKLILNVSVESLTRWREEY